MKEDKDVIPKGGAPSSAKTGKRPLYFYAAIFLAIIVVLLFFLFLTPNDGGQRYEDEDIFTFSDVSGILRIDNPYGVTRVMPSADGLLRIQVNKVSKKARLMHPEKGLPQIESVHKQNKTNLDFKLVYHLNKPDILYADLFIYCTPVQDIEIQSKTASVWVQDIASNVRIVTKGKKQTTTISQVKGKIDVRSSEGLNVIEMADDFPLTLNSGRATNVVVFKGNNPGVTSISGTGGQTSLFLSKTANAKIITQTKGVFFSDLTREQLDVGKERSDGTSVITKLGSEGNTIHIEHTKGEITLSKDIPPVVVPDANPPDQKPESTNSP